METPIARVMVEVRSKAARLGVILSAIALAVAPLGAQDAAASSDPSYRRINSVGPLARLESAGGAVDGSAVGILVYDTAYIAVFEMLPGFGARLLWPTPPDGPERPLAPGLTRIPVPSPWVGDPYAPKQRLPEPQGRVVYLLAGRKPLGLEPSRRSAEALATAVGRLAFYGADPVELVNRLQQALRLRVEMADRLTYVPGAALTVAPLGRTLTVRCGDGRSYEIARNEAEFRCPSAPR